MSVYHAVSGFCHLCAQLFTFVRTSGFIMIGYRIIMFLVALQDIIPQSLLENYLGMVDPSRAQTVDTEITRHCAYNLPAVAYTLGRRNWHCIKHLYETLSQAMQVSRVSLLTLARP